MMGGHIATLEKKPNGECTLETDYKGELSDIYNATPGKTNLEKLAAMGQAPLGWCNADDVELYYFGCKAILCSDSLQRDGSVLALLVSCNNTYADDTWYSQTDAVSSVIVLDK